MQPQLKRHEIQVLLRAGHPQEEVARFAGVSLSTVYRLAKEEPVTHADDVAARRARRLGRPSKVEALRPFVVDLLQREPGLMTLEVLRRARLHGYTGGKSAFYQFLATLRPPHQDLQMRFEGLPGEFSQHDFGQVDVRYVGGTQERVHFFASRLKWSRWAEVTLVPNETAEPLIRTLAQHFLAFGGVPLCAVFDRPKTIALQWNKQGEVTEWNPTFAYAALELGFSAELCWPHRPRQKGSVENLVGWVKSSFFKQRRFVDRDDLQQQLRQWLVESNETRPNRATDVIPAVRLTEDRKRLRPLRVLPDQLALRVPIQVSPTADVVHEEHSYSMPPDAACLPGTLYLYADRVRIVAGAFEATHPRQRGRGRPSRLPEHRAGHLAALSGKRGKRYLMRQHLFETGEAAVQFLTELVHLEPRNWIGEVERLHALLQEYGPEPLDQAFRIAVAQDMITADFVAQCLGRPAAVRPPLFHLEHA